MAPPSFVRQPWFFVCLSLSLSNFSLSLRQRCSHKKMRSKQMTQQSREGIKLLSLEAGTLPALFGGRQHKALLLQASSWDWSKTFSLIAKRPPKKARTDHEPVQNDTFQKWESERPGLLKSRTASVTWGSFNDPPTSTPEFLSKDYLPWARFQAESVTVRTWSDQKLRLLQSRGHCLPGVELGSW